LEGIPVKIVNLKHLPRTLSVIAVLGLIAGCGNIVQPGDNQTGSQPTVVLSTPAAAATSAAPPTTVPAPSGQPVPALPADIQVTTTASGLQYADVAVGSGQAAKAGDTVSMLYTGYLTDGTVFDSNVASGQPLVFTLGQGQVIPGWDEGIVGLKEGGKRRLIIPAALGYGSQGAGGVIPPDAELIFDVELVSTGAAAPAKPAAGPVPALPADIQVTTTASGLQYADVEAGTGQAAKAGDTVSMLYTGYLTDGTIFDSNVASGQPFDFTIGQGQVIQGWDEGIVGMKQGGKRRLILPSALGYGSQGAGGVIPPDAELIFDVELKGILTK
jgi:peptidylprolyl isomerase